MTHESDANKIGVGFSLRFHYRVLNTYPIPKGLSFVAVDLVSCAHWWDRTVIVRLKPAHLAMGTCEQDLRTEDDVELAPHTFTRLRVISQSRSSTVSEADVFKQTQSVRAIRFTFLISPKKIIHVYHPVTANDGDRILQKWKNLT